jgi:transcriptional regulator with XRE-family HTH domain
MPFSGERLKATREKKGLTQRELARLVGMAEAQLSRYEHDKTEPSLKVLEILAKHLEVSSDFLLGLTNDPDRRYGDAEISEEERNVLEILRREGWIGVLRLGVERIAK